MKRLSRLIAGGAAVGSALAVTGFLLTSEQKRLIKSPGIKIFKYGVPEINISLHNYKGHWLAYDSTRRIPVWVAEFLDKDTLYQSWLDQSKAERKNLFLAAPNIQYQASDDDYKGSGFDRGHMAAAANHERNQQEMDETFYYSNIAPQNGSNNRGFWKMLEDFCRELVTDNRKVTVLTGPLFKPKRGENNKNFVLYEVIGDNHVAVPTHFFKVIVLDDDSWIEPYLGVFIIPNKPLKGESSLTEYQVELKDLEHYLGTKLLPKLNSTNCKDLCTVSVCELKAQVKLKVLKYAKRLKSAQNLDLLEEIWKEEGGQQKNTYCNEVYTQRKDYFNNNS